jgi:NADH-quinone oxidoreductase subunit C
MDFKGIYDRLRAIDAPGLVGCDEPRKPNPEDKKDKGRAGDAFVLVEAQRLREFLEVCKQDPELCFEQLVDFTAADPAADDENLWIIAQLRSLEHRQSLAVKCLLAKAQPSMPTLVPVHRASQWFERECAEMFGITFEGHPDPRHMLLPEDWAGHPLRKDYEFPTEYHGISCT